MTKFFKDTWERVLSTAVQAAIAAGSAALLSGMEANAETAAYVTVAAAVLSFVKAFVAKKFGSPDSASFVE